MKTSPNRTASESAPDKANSIKSSAVNQRPYVIELIESTIFRAGSERMVIPPLTIMKALRTVVPYCFKKANTDHTIPVNRDYMPLGFAKNGRFADYASPHFAAFWLTDSGLDRSIVNEDDYLFDDRSRPFSSSANDRRDYIFRLWWALRNFGLQPPKLPLDEMLKAADACSIDINLMLKELGRLP